MSLYDRWFPLPEVPAVPVIIANNVVVPPVPLDVNVASIVPISGVVYQGSNPWLISGPVTGPLTDAELRASPVLTSGTFNTTAPTLTNLQEASLQLDNRGNLKVSGVVAVLGDVTVDQGTSPWIISGAVTGPLTNTELRATPVPVSGTVTANAGTNLNTSLLALDSTVAKDASLTTINTSINTLLKPANTLAAVTTLGSITNALPAGTNVIGHVITDSGSVVNATLSAETTKVIGTVNQGTSPWVISGTVTTVTATGTLTDRSGSATNVSVQIMAANSSRKYLFIQNLSNAPIYFNFTSAATVGGSSLELSQFASFVMEGQFVSTEAVNIIRSGGSNLAFCAKEG